MLKTEKVKTHVMFPAELLQAIDKTVGGRKRSKFIVEAAKEKLEGLQISQLTLQRNLAIMTLHVVYLIQTYPQYIVL